MASSNENITLQQSSHLEIEMLQSDPKRAVHEDDVDMKDKLWSIEGKLWCQRELVATLTNKVASLKNEVLHQRGFSNKLINHMWDVHLPSSTSDDQEDVSSNSECSSQVEVEVAVDGEEAIAAEAAADSEDEDL